MITRFAWVGCMVLAVTTLASTLAWADPCGMVPPVYLGPGQPITRVGKQQTYVFHKNGVETFVIRPGFKGKVDEFGMLIPFPNPPAIRKVPDHIFSHVAAAVDPPEVVVDLRTRYDRFGRNAGGANSPSKAPQSRRKLAFDAVKVISQDKKPEYSYSDQKAQVYNR